VGLNAHPQPKPALLALYSRLLISLSRLPSCTYKQSTEALVKQRMDILAKYEQVSEIESQINCGQIEELIIQAENELKLSELMAEWKPWEPLQETPAPDQWKPVGTA
jgi:NADH dehydrogenase (ubiquinone) 1 alpha subcomplex subunit 5